MYCAKCGNEIKQGENFCTECGARITRREYAAQSSGQTVSRSATSGQKPKLKLPEKKAIRVKPSKARSLVIDGCCRYCGAKLAAEATHCPECGATAVNNFTSMTEDCTLGKLWTAGRTIEKTIGIFGIVAAVIMVIFWLSLIL